MDTSGERHPRSATAWGYHLRWLGALSWLVGHAAAALAASPSWVHLEGGSGCQAAAVSNQDMLKDTHLEDKGERMLKRRSAATHCAANADQSSASATTTGTHRLGRTTGLGATAQAAGLGTAVAQAALFTSFQDRIMVSAPGAGEGDHITYTATLDLDGLLTGPAKQCGELTASLSLLSPNEAIGDTASFSPEGPFQGAKRLRVVLRKPVNATPILLRVDASVYAIAGNDCPEAQAQWLKALQPRLRADHPGTNTLSDNGVDYR